MKYLVLLCDGMSDWPVEALGGRTPMEAAHKPFMDKLAETAELGLVQTVAKGMKPGSDVANLSVLGYDPALYYSGRSPLEAGSMGVDMKPTDVSLRCNLVTLSDQGDVGGGDDGGGAAMDTGSAESYGRKTMEDYSGGDISTAEAAVLMDAVGRELGKPPFTFYNGISYRHLTIWAEGSLELGGLIPPHDIGGRVIGPYLSAHPNAKPLLDMMRRSYSLLAGHPINEARKQKGKRPANSIWFWGEGVRSNLPLFREKYGLRGVMISAVDLLKGIAHFAGMDILRVPGATGYLDSNFTGKAKAALQAFRDGGDLVYLHVEAPDECGHRREVQGKVKAIELIDQWILGPILKEMETDDITILICPDHPTPLSLGTHTDDPVPYLLYNSRKPKAGAKLFCEKTAASSGIFEAVGHELLMRVVSVDG